MDNPCHQLDPAGFEPKDNPNALREKIQQTQAEIGETVNSLQARLSPERVKEKMKAAAKETLESAKEKVRLKAEQWQRQAAKRIVNNPLPAAMVGLGLIWLWQRAACAARKQDRFQNYSLNPHEEWPDYAPEEDSGRSPHTRSGTRNSLDAMKTKAQEAGQQAREHISQWTSHAQDSLEDWKSRASSQSYQFRSMAKERGQRVKGEFERYLQDSPLTVGIMTIAMGAAIGLFLPRSQKEDAWLGESRDRLVDQAKAAAQEILPTGQQILGGELK